jgi:undecaprenyl-diphosphatase
VTPFQSLAYGIVQGLAEFLPVSSSGHLALMPKLLGWPDQGQAFDVALHVGTLIPLVVYFRRELMEMACALVGALRERRIGDHPDRQLACNVLLGSLPGGLLGYLLEKQSEETFRDVRIIAAALLVMGLVLWLVDRLAPARRPIGELSARESLLIGLAQALAIIPGVSRSGATITAARARTLDRVAAARFSFLLAVPITAGAALKKVPHLLRAEGDKLPLLIAVVSAAVAGYLAIGLLLRMVRGSSYLPFAVYRVLLGGGLLAAIYLGGFTPAGGW